MRNVVAPIEADLDWGRALAWRLRRQFLLEPASPAELVSLVARLGGVHAQVLSSAAAALAVRMDRANERALEQALRLDRSLVKLWAMRGTLHVLPAADHPAWVAAMNMYSSAYAHYGMRDPDLLSLAESVGEVLHVRVLTRAELEHEVRRLGRVPGPVVELLAGSWGSVLKPASFRGHLCYGAGRAGRSHFTNPSTWLAGPQVPVAPDEALAEVTRRYFGVYGPATTQDLGAWWGVSARLAATMVALIRPELAEVQIEQQRYWILHRNLPEVVLTAALDADDLTVRLLPSFDPWVIAGNRRGRPGIGNPTLNPAYRSAIYRPQGWVSPAVIVNGLVVGTWTGQAGPVAVDFFEPPDRQTRAAVDTEIELLRHQRSAQAAPEQSTSVHSRLSRSR